jgi:ABC-type phosphate/phosphonate transport system substrate-binding protein
MSFLAGSPRSGPVLFLGALLIGWSPSAQAENKPQFLRIGTTGTLKSGRSAPEEKAALAILKSFIKDETGFDNEIVDEKDWQELGDQLAKGKVQLGAFHGYEFAWAQQRDPALRPLVLAVNGQLFPSVYVVTRKNDKARNFAGLQGQSIALLGHAHGGFPHLFLDREVQAHNKQPKTFFSKVVTKDNVEDILDDVVDGTVQAAVVERASLEAYKRRKPGRFNQLKEIAKSPQVLPGVIAYYDKHLNAATLDRFRKGLLSANQKEKGQTLLTMFRLTGFRGVPPNFAQMLTQTQKAFPAPAAVK